MATVLDTKTADDDTHIRGSVRPEEWQVRVDLAAAYRLVAYYGWDDLIFTHLSAKVPGPDKHFLINPYDMMFDEITASSLVKIDVEGQPVVPSAHPVNPAGFHQSEMLKLRRSVVFQNQILLDRQIHHQAGIDAVFRNAAHF